MKRLFLSLALVVLFTLSFSASLASALPLETQFDRFIQEHVRPVASLLLGDAGGVGEFSAGEILFVKVLVFFLLVSVISISIKNVPRIGENKKLAVFISVIISILSVRYLTSAGLVSFIWLPYGVLGIAISSLLPLIIFFFFLEGFDSSFLRKIGWSTFFVVFIALAYFRWDELSLVTTAFNAAWIYVGIAVVSALLLFFDRDIHAAFLTYSLSRISDAQRRVQAAQITNEIIEKEKQLSTAAFAEDDTARRTLVGQIDALKRQRKNILSGR